MAEITLNEKHAKNLLREMEKLRHENATLKQSRSKKHVQKRSEPHITSRVVNGRTYYYYRHGDADMIHLGTADFILEAVREKRGK